MGSAQRLAWHGMAPGRLLAGRADSATTPPCPLDGPANHLPPALAARPARSRSSRGRPPGNTTLTRRRPVGSTGIWVVWLPPDDGRTAPHRIRHGCARRWAGGGWPLSATGLVGGARVCVSGLDASYRRSLRSRSVGCPIGPVRCPGPYTRNHWEIADAASMLNVSLEMARNDESTSLR